MGGLCVFVIAVGAIIGFANIATSAVYTGAPNRAYCVDLTSGKMSYLPPSTTNVRWLVKPFHWGYRCKLQGVLKLTPPSWSKCVYLHMIFEKPKGFTFHIGDMWLNVAKGGDIANSQNDAEIWGYYSYLKAYRRRKKGNTNIIYKYNVVKSAMLIELGRHSMYLTNYAGYTYGYKHDDGLFSFHYNNLNDNVYLGLNRVIHDVKGTPYKGRTGSGLCSVCIYFHNNCEFKPPS